MKINFLYIIFFFCQFSIGQEIYNSSDIKERSGLVFTQLHFSVPLWFNPDYGEENPITGEKDPFILPDGLSGRAGVGFHYDQWIGISINSGMDWKGSKCLVVAPLFGALRISPQVSESLRITTEAGYGKSFAIGRGGLVGDFKKISLGLESVEGGFGLYMEFCQYGFTLHRENNIRSLSLGISILMF